MQWNSRWLLLGAVGCLSASVASPQDTFDLRSRFTAISQAYAAADGAKYTSLLRATLRHARRLTPAQCVVYQRQLMEVARTRYYDGLEPVWLVYQDCAAAGTQKALGADRLRNAQLLKEGLRFRKAPLAQVPLRVTHWNSAIERGVRADAVRAVLQQYAGPSLGVTQRWSLHRALAQPATTAVLCGLPTRLNQYGTIALPELLRKAGCLLGLDAVAEDVCGSLFPDAGSSGGGSTPGPGQPRGLSADDMDRLKEMCNGLTGAGSIGTSGIDDLDGFTSDDCASEDTTRLYDTAKIADMIMDCYGSGDGNPFGMGGTSADIGRYLNVEIDYKIDDKTYGAALMTGKSHDDPGRNFYGGYGASPEEAREALQKQLLNNPPEDSTATENADGSVTVDSEYDRTNEDGSSTHVRESNTLNDDGSQDHSRTETNQNGTGHHEQSHTNEDGSGSGMTLEWDKDGNVTRKTETTTNKDGKTETTTTDYEYDDDGSIVKETKKTETSDLPDEGGFDPHNPACQGLMAIEIMPGSSRTAFFNQAFGRPYFQDPRKVNPNPDQDPGTYGQEPFCGGPAVGSNNPPAKCNLPVMCTPDSEPDDTCTCRQKPAGSIARLGCVSALCADGTIPVPVGADACTCVTADPGTPGPPPPLPTASMNIYFQEMVWNHSGTEVFVTTEMAREHGGVPPPRP